MLKPTQDASRRTKSRIGMHNLVVSVGTLKDIPKHMQGNTLFVCKGHCDWFGWLPNNEFSVKE